MVNLFWLLQDKSSNSSCDSNHLSRILTNVSGLVWPFDEPGLVGLGQDVTQGQWIIESHKKCLNLRSAKRNKIITEGKNKSSSLRHQF